MSDQQTPPIVDEPPEEPRGNPFRTLLNLIPGVKPDPPIREGELQIPLDQDPVDYFREVAARAQAGIIKPQPLATSTTNVLGIESLFDRMKFSEASKDELRHDWERWLEAEHARRRKSTFWARSGNWVINAMGFLMKSEYARVNVALGVRNGEPDLWQDLKDGWTEKETPTTFDFWRSIPWLDDTKFPVDLLVPGGFFQDKKMSPADLIAFMDSIFLAPETVVNPFAGIGRQALTKSGRAAVIATQAAMKTGGTAKEAAKIVLTRVDEISETHKLLKKALDKGHNLEFSENVRHQFEQGHRRLTMLGHPFKTPKFTMLRDWRAARAMMSGTEFERLGNIPVSVFGAPIGAGIGAAVAPDDPESRLKSAFAGALLGTGLGFELLRFSPGIQLKRFARGEGSPMMSAGRTFSEKLGVVIGELPILKMPAYEHFGTDQSLFFYKTKFGKKVGIHAVEMMRRQSDAAFVDYLTKFGKAMRNDVPVVRDVIGLGGQAFVKHWRPWNAPVGPWEEFHHDATMWYENFGPAEKRRFLENLQREMKLSTDLPAMMNRVPLNKDGYMMTMMRAVARKEVSEEIATQIVMVLEAPANVVGSPEYDAAAQTVLRFLGTSDDPALRNAIHVEPYNYRLSIEHLQDGIRRDSRAIEVNMEDLARLERGEQPLREAARGLDPEVAQAAILRDTENIERTRRGLQERMNNLQDMAEETGLIPQRPDPQFTEQPDIPEIDILRVADDPVPGPDGQRPLPKAPPVRSKAPGIERLQQQRDALEHQINTIHAKKKNAIAVSRQAGNIQAVAASRELDRLSIAEEEIREAARMMDGQMAAIENAERVKEAGAGADKAFTKETQDILKGTPAAGLKAVDTIPDAKLDADAIATKLQQAQNIGDETNAARHSQKLDRLNEETTLDYANRTFSGKGAAEQRQDGRQLMEDAWRAAYLTERAEKAPEILKNAEKAIAELDDIALQIREGGIVPETKVAPPVKRPRVGARTIDDAALSDVELAAKDVEDMRAATVDMVEKEIGVEEAAKIADELDIDESLLSPPVVYARRSLRNQRAPEPPETGFTLENLGHDEGTIRAQMIPHAYDSLLDLKKVDPDLNPDWIDVRVAGPHLNAGALPDEPIHGVAFFDGPADVEDMNYALSSYGQLARAGGEATGLPEHAMEWTVHRLRRGEDPNAVLRALSDEPLQSLELPEGTVMAPELHGAQDLVTQSDDFLDQAEILASAPHHHDITTRSGQTRKAIFERKADKLQGDIRDWFTANPDAKGPEAAELRRVRSSVEAARPTPLRVDGPSINDMIANRELKLSKPTQASLDRIRPRKSDGTSVVDMKAMPKSLQKLPLKIRPPDLQKNLDLAKGSTETEFNHWPLGANQARVQEFATGDEALEAFKAATKDKAINHAEFVPEVNVIEVLDDEGTLYQIGLKYDVPQSKLSRKAELANGTFNDLPALEHYREDFLLAHANDPEIRGLMALRGLGKTVGKVTDLTTLPEGPVRSETVKGLADLRNAFPDLAKTLDLNELRVAVQDRMKKYLDKFPVDYVNKDGEKRIIRLSPKEMGLSLEERPRRVYGMFRETQYPIGAIVDVDGREAKIVGYGDAGLRKLDTLEGADKKIRMLVDTAGDNFWVSEGDLQLADLAAGTRRGESFWEWAHEMSKNDIGVLERGAFKDLINRAMKKVGLRRVAAEEWIDEIVRLDPSHEAEILTISKSFADQMDDMWSVAFGRNMVSAYIPNYVPHVALELTSTNWMGGGTADAIRNKQYPHMKHRSLQDNVKDLNMMAEASGRKPYFNKHAGIAMGHRGVQNIEAVRTFDFIDREVNKWGVLVKDLNPDTFDNATAVMERMGVSPKMIAEAREIGEDLKRRTGSGNIREAMDMARQRLAEAPAGAPQSLTMETRELKRLVDRWESITPKLGLYLPKGALRFYKTSALSSGDIEKGVKTGRSLTEIAAETREYTDLVSDLWNVKDGTHLVAVEWGKLKTVLAASKRGVPAYMMPVEVADMMNGYFQNKLRFTRGNKPFVRFLEVMDAIQRTWVNYTLFPVPVYHFRNAISDMVLAMQQGHYDLPEYMAELNHYQVTGGKGPPIRDPFDNEYEFKELVKLFDDGGLTTSGWSAVAMQKEMLDLFMPKTSVKAAFAGAGVGGAVGGPGGAAAGFFLGSTLDFTSLSNAVKKEGIKAFLKWRPYLNDRNFVIWYSKKVARTMEANRRMALALKLVKTRGLHPTEAAMEANRVFLDFRNLSDFERTTMRRLFPFWSWMRHDLPRQAEMFVTRPHSIVAINKIRNLAEKLVIPEETKMGEDFGDGTRDMSMPIPIEELEDGMIQEWYMRSWLPQGELMSVSEPVTALTGMLTPLIKVLLETGTPLPDVLNEKVGGFRGLNKNLFFNYPLEGDKHFLGAEMSKRDAQLLRHIRLINIWDKVAHNQHLPWYRAAIEQFVGRPYTADMHSNRRHRYYDLVKQRNALITELQKELGNLEDQAKIGTEFDPSLLTREEKGLGPRKIRKLTLKQRRIIEMGAELRRVIEKLTLLMQTPVMRREIEMLRGREPLIEGDKPSLTQEEIDVRPQPLAKPEQ